MREKCALCTGLRSAIKLLSCMGPAQIHTWPSLYGLGRQSAIIVCHAGHEGYLVGGAVRDLLLGAQPKDFDILTTATPVQVSFGFLCPSLLVWHTAWYCTLRLLLI